MLALVEQVLDKTLKILNKELMLSLVLLVVFMTWWNVESSRLIIFVYSLWTKLMKCFLAVSNNKF